MTWTPRLAQPADIPALEALIPLSVHALQAGFYTEAQRRAALGPVFGVDRQLIRDQTYYVIEQDGQIIACGGWSKRKSLFGGDSARGTEDPELDPLHEPARIRAFFVHPAWARRGLGRSLLKTCEAAIIAAGFRTADLVATLAGEPLYAAGSDTVVEHYDIPLTNGLPLPAVRMTKSLQPHATRITIRAASPADAETVTGILREAAQWLEQTGHTMWRDNELLPERVAEDVAAGLFFLAEMDGEPAGTVKFQLQDSLFWPDMPVNESAFVHRLAVRRQFSSQGISTALLQRAVERTRGLSRPFLRLDCEASRSRLRAVYERFGFRHHSDRQVGPYYVSRYEYDVRETH